MLMKEMNSIRMPLVLAAIAIAPSVYAFEIPTHAAMTSEAVAQSQFSRNPESSLLMRRLGIFDPRYLDGKKYFEIGQATTVRKNNTLQEDAI